MKTTHILEFAVLLAVFSGVSFASTVYDIHVLSDKSSYAQNESMIIYGYVLNVTSNSTANVSSYVENSTIRLRILDIANNTFSNYTMATDNNGTFYSNSSFYNNGNTVRAPNLSGTFTLLANYSDASNTSWTSKLIFSVINKAVDEIIIQPNKASFYTSESMTIKIKAVQLRGDNKIGISGIPINGSMRTYIDNSILSAFNCTTSTDGTCNVTMNAPSSAGKYVLEVNNFIGYMRFEVVPFDVDIYVKDSTGTTYKNVFRRGDSGIIEARVSYNSTNPTGSFNASGTIIDYSGNGKQNLTSVLLNSTNGFVNSISFTVGNAFSAGSVYIVNISITDGTSTVTKTATFEVRDWTFSFSKKKTDSGFEHGYTAFPGSVMFFQVFPTERENATIITSLENNITAKLTNSLGVQISNSSMTFNSSCGSLQCYEFNFTAPATSGTYSISVTVNYTDIAMTQERTIKVTDTIASVFSADSEAGIKELFSTTEYIYIKPSAKNSTTNISISDIEFGSLTYENGTKTEYSQASGNFTNMTDSTYEWVWNSTSGLMRLDPPKKGGIYILEIYVNNKTAYATTKFAINPYDVCSQAKATSDTSTVDYWWQFRTSDTIYFQITINEAQNPSGKILNTTAAKNGTYGIGSACSFNTTQKQAVKNATITISKVMNVDSNKQESLNTTASICQATDNNGGYLCTAKADDNKWDGGKHVVFFDVTGSDGNTTDKGNGFFDARAFFIYGYANSWYNKNNDNITLSVRLYEAGSGWWNSGTGLSGTMSIQKIHNYGSSDEWIWPPVDYPYNTSDLNDTTITNGAGTMTVPVNRTTDRSWKTGQYTVVVKATVNGETDYGEIWFSVKKWDAYAMPVETSGNNLNYKNSFNSKENISLYVKLSPAGGYSDYGGTFLGNVTMSVKSISDYSKWPSSELAKTSYNSTVTTVNKSSPWYSTSNVLTNYNLHIINITRTGSTWDPGYYSVVINLNNSETGYGSFNIINFRAEAFPSNSTGYYNYYTKGAAAEPIYFNISTTKSWKYSYDSSDYINTTVEDATVRVWNQATNSVIEYNYPEDFNISSTAVNGNSIISINKSTTWSSGWYYGEMKLKDSDNQTGNVWIYFTVKPFRISTTLSNVISTTGNLSLNLSILEPHWYQDTKRNANYSVIRAYETTWSYSGSTITDYTFVPTSIFTQNISLNITPSSGRWASGWRYLSVIVKDNNTNSTEEQWVSFQALPFQTSVSRTSASKIGPNTNVTVNISITDPISGASTYGNLSSVYYYGWPSNTEYRFSIGGCDSSVNNSCMINGSQIVTIFPSSGGWDEGYRYMYFKFVDTTNASVKIETWNSIYFEVAQPLTGYMYAVDKNSFYTSSYDKSDNVTLYLYSLQNLNGNSIGVNVTNVQYAPSSSSCWSDTCRVYQDATWSVMSYSNGAYTVSPNQSVSGSGHIRLNHTGNWTAGEYYVRISVSASGDTATIKNGYFKIADRTPPTVNLTSPSAGTIVTNTISLSGTSTENANCHFNTVDYGTYYSSYCANANSTNSTAICNLTLYSNDTSYYSEVASSSYRGILYGSDRTYAYEYGNFVSTGGTSHSASLSTTYMGSQYYGIKMTCSDSDWNYASSDTVIFVNKTVPLNVSISLPANTTYNDTLVRALNYTIKGTSIDKCFYSLNGNANVTLNSCGNATFNSTNNTLNTMIVYVNNTGGASNSSAVRFSVRA